MEKTRKLKIGEITSLLIVLLLNVLWLVSLIIFMQKNGGMNPIAIASIIGFAGTILYCFVDYRRPHGNLMRYLLLFFACTAAVMIVMDKNQEDLYRSTYLAIIILTTYMGGRLNKYKQNVVISIIVLILEVINVYPFISLVANSNALTFIGFFASIGPVANWLALSVSYIVRYSPHKEAGLIDKE